MLSGPRSGRHRAIHKQTALGPRVQMWETVPDQGSVSPAPQTGRSQACRHRRPNVASAGHGPLTSCCHIASPCPTLPCPVGQSPCLPGNPSGKQCENSKDQKEFRLQKHTECSANFHRTGSLLTLETRGSGLWGREKNATDFGVFQAKGNTGIHRTEGCTGPAANLELRNGPGQCPDQSLPEGRGRGKGCDWSPGLGARCGQQCADVVTPHLCGKSAYPGKAATFPSYGVQTKEPFPKSITTLFGLKKKRNPNTRYSMDGAE